VGGLWPTQDAWTFPLCVCVRRRLGQPCEDAAADPPHVGRMWQWQPLPRAQVAGHRPNLAWSVVGGAIAVAAALVREYVAAATARLVAVSMRVAAVAVRAAAGGTTAKGGGTVTAQAFGAARWCRWREGGGSA